MRTALVIGGRPDYAGPAVRILPRTGARIYPSGHVYEAEVEFSINNNDQEQLNRCPDVPTSDLRLGPLTVALRRAD